MWSNCKSPKVFCSKKIDIQYFCSLETDHRLIVEQIKSQLEESQSEAKELREKVTELQRQLTEERFDKQLSNISILN